MKSELVMAVKAKLQSIGWNWSDMIIEELLHPDGCGDAIQTSIGALLREAGDTERTAGRIVELIQKHLGTE